MEKNEKFINSLKKWESLRISLGINNIFIFFKNLIKNYKKETQKQNRKNLKHLLNESGKNNTIYLLIK